MDINVAVTEAQQTFTELLEVLETIPQESINTVPFAGSWTAARDVQHIILSACGFVQLLNGPVIDTARDPEQNITNFRDILLNFDHKMHSPDFIVPGDNDYDKQELLNAIPPIKDDYIKAIQTLDLTKTCLAFELPGAGHITRAEAVAFTNTHTIRHVHQLKNIRQKLGI